MTDEASQLSLENRIANLEAEMERIKETNAHIYLMAWYGYMSLEKIMFAPSKIANGEDTRENVLDAATTQHALFQGSAVAGRKLIWGDIEDEKTT